MDKFEEYINLASNLECSCDYASAYIYWVRALSICHDPKEYIWIKTRIRKCRDMNKLYSF